VTREAPDWPSLLGMGVALALLLVLGLAVGWVIDRFAHTLPIFTLVGLVVGIAAAGRYAYVEFHKFYRD
jgi:F0F1-type ATP synthase assembly protein I